MNLFIQTINGMQEILAICPCCGDMFRLVDGKLVLQGKQPSGNNPYTSLLKMERHAANEAEKISLAEERFEERFEKHKEALIETSRKLAKKRLRKIDPVFTQKKIDHQDVKVIFDPVEYIVFKGLSNQQKLSEIRLMSRKPTSTKAEKLILSIEGAIKSGNLAFETLILKETGDFEINNCGAK
jgi:predicted Holliday junction resolvase-like endonuclease